MKPRVHIEPAGHVRVALADQTIAETERAQVVHEIGLPDRYYVPRADVRVKLLDGSGGGICPWKGGWRHLDVEVAGERIADGAWTYDQPTPLGEPLRDHVAFYEDKVSVEHPDRHHDHR